MRKIIAKSLDEMPTSFGVNHLAGYLDISLEAAYKLSSQKDFPSMEIGRKHIINRDLFKKWLVRKYNQQF